MAITGCDTARPKAAIYCRTSSDDNDLVREEGKKTGQTPSRASASESIEEQKKLGNARAEKLGFDVVGIFADKNISGRTYPKGYAMADPAFDSYFNSHIKRSGKRARPELGRLLDLKGIDVIIVRDIYRLLRPAFQSHLGNHIWQLLTSRKIRVHSIGDGDIDTNKFEDLMVTNLKLQIADQAKRQEVEAAIRSLKAKKDQGALASGVKCFGFRSSGHQTVAPMPDELKIIRLIYDRYLSGMNILQLAKHLNDDLCVSTMSGKAWTVNHLRKVLLRPWYCGMRYNSSGELIDSTVFPTGPDAIVTKDEYYRVLASFDKRKKYEVKGEKDVARQDRHDSESIPLRGGKKIGIHHSKGPVHPFSGLVKCGYCGRHLYITKVVNKYFYKTVPVDTYYYHCHTPASTKNEKYADCREVRIKEMYPPKSLELKIQPNGNGLIEALFPLLFHGYITRYIEQTTLTPGLIDMRERLRTELDKITENEARLFRQQVEDVVDAEQFKLGMKMNREKKSDLQRQLTQAEAELQRLSTDGSDVPLEVFTDPHQISREVVQDLAHATFKEIVVFSDKIKVVLKILNPDGENHSFEIERVRTRNSRDLPFWNARINTPVITPKSKLGIAYYYRSTQAGLYYPPWDLYHDDRMEIVSLGSNSSVDVKRNKGLREPNNSDTFLKNVYGPLPTYQRKLEVNSNAFFSRTARRKMGIPDMPKG